MVAERGLDARENEMPQAEVLEPYATELKALIKKGQDLYLAMMYECDPEDIRAQVQEARGQDADEFLGDLPSFRDDYQPWYSESKALIGQLLPDRLADFTRYYERPKSRRPEITFANYTIEDYLQGLRVGSSRSPIVEPRAAIPSFLQQLQIVRSMESRLRSSLFDIRQLSQADLFDSELESAGSLVRNGFLRAAGAVAGVVLERHLKEVCANRSVTVRKRKPQIADLNDLLKDAAVVDTPQWRLIQHLGDLRNLCVHDREAEPSADQVKDLVEGVEKVIKTVF